MCWIRSWFVVLGIALLAMSFASLNFAVADEEPAATEVQQDDKDEDHDGDDAHAGHAHDVHDLGHAGGSDNIENPAYLATDMALFSFIVFLILLAVLWAFAWGPITKGLDAREEGILAKINQATEAAEKAQATLAEYQAKLDAGAEEVREMMAEARRDAEATKTRITAEAEAAAAKQRQQAIDDIHRAKEGALRELADMSATQAVELAQGIVGRQITGEDHARLVQEAVDRMPSSN